MKSRIDWVDAAKGMSILLVVLHHVVILMEPHGLIPGPVSAVNSAMASLRMPLFFLASGLFAAAPLAASWRTLLHKRVAFFLYLFVLWTILQSIVFMWVLPADVLPPDSPLTWVDVAWEALLPGPAMWFLYALAVFSIVGKLVRRTPAWAQLVVSGVLCAAVGAGMLTFESFAWTFMARYLFFFLLGVHVRTVVETVAERSSLLLCVGGGALCGLTAGASVALGLREVFGVAFLLNVVAVTFGVLLAGHLSRFRLFMPLVVLGRNTLPVYLTNVLVVSAVVAVTRHLPLPQTVGWVVPPILAVLVTGFTLLGTEALRWAGASWLFALPRFLAHRPAPTPAPAPEPSPVWTPAVLPTTETGRHRLQAAGRMPPEPVLSGVGTDLAGPPTGPVVPDRIPGRWQARRDAFRDGRSAFWDTDDWTASARPTVLMKPVRG
ncbi:acyltransferase family protein [Pseudonocardia endophytica]|uniref:Putative membrane protein YcfT n=1 Tax=Pseudonocardia endophytica TaxID=401976 RepID=A0A4R1HX47_PSEEN|nr:acyltransferase family protein [Pseudonocardia endophytica]TCK25370.1 putative membrane protein YcfT [Pseudonocardia endophytica]